MARKVFYSFHYSEDSWRVSQVKNMGVVEGQQILSSNEWEKVKKDGDTAIKNWIDDKMKGCSCLVVLIGKNTADRKWVKYEVKKAFQDGKALLGIHSHKLQDEDKNQSTEGNSPFDITIDDVNLSEISKTYNPTFTTSKYVYDDIKEKLPQLVEDAIKLR
jgi:hypothetical protein